MAYKIYLVIAIISTISYMLYLSASQNLEKEVLTRFHSWKEQHKKQYTQSEERYRYQIFKQNYAFIVEHNRSGLYSFTLELNQFADLPNEEFMTQFLKPVPEYQQNYQEQNHIQDRAIPDTLDWSTIITFTVENEGDAEAVLISALETIEYTYFIKKGKKIKLSKQEILDCLHPPYGVIDIYDYAKLLGISDSLAYPETSGVCDQSGQPRYFISSYNTVEQKNSQAFLTAINIAPLSVYINSSGLSFQLYQGGIYNRACSGSENQLNHAVVATGYDNIERFYRVMNSWGETWGESGFIRLAQVDQLEGQCGIHQKATYSVV